MRGKGKLRGHGAGSWEPAGCRGTGSRWPPLPFLRALCVCRSTPFSSHLFSTPFLCTDGRVCKGLGCFCAGPESIAPLQMHVTVHTHLARTCLHTRTATLRFFALNKEMWQQRSLQA